MEQLPIKFPQEWREDHRNQSYAEPASIWGCHEEVWLLHKADSWICGDAAHIWHSLHKQPWKGGACRSVSMNGFLYMGDVHQVQLPWLAMSWKQFPFGVNLAQFSWCQNPSHARGTSQQWQHQWRWVSRQPDLLIDLALSHRAIAGEVAHKTLECLHLRLLGNVQDLSPRDWMAFQATQRSATWPGNL